MTECYGLLTNGLFQRTSVYSILSHVILSLAIVFLLGVLNFALHRAVLESGHRILEEIPDNLRLLGGRLSLMAEFFVLLSAMLLIANGWEILAWAYLGYSALNAVSAWLILTRRI